MPKTAGFAVRRKIIEELLKDPAWAHEFESAETTWDVAAVLVEFCISRGYKVATIREKPNY